MEDPTAAEREAPPADKERIPGSDPIYKRLYAFPEMVADLLRSVLPADALGALDLATLDKVPASYVGDDYRQRHGDAVWRVERAGRWTYVLVLLEFQSSSDATMALRVLEYTAMLYRELLRRKMAEPGRLPPVLPIVLYNGESPWGAARNVGELIDEPGPALLPYQPSQRYAMVDERHASALSHTKRRVSVCAGVRARGAVAKAYRAYSKRRQQSGRMPARAPFGWQPEAPQRCCARSKYGPVRLRGRALLRNFRLPLMRRFVWDRALARTMRASGRGRWRSWSRAARQRIWRA